MIWYYNSSYLYLWTKIIVKKNCHIKMKAFTYFSLQLARRVIMEVDAP